MSRKKIQGPKKCEYCKKDYIPFEGYMTKYWKLSRFCSKSCSAFSRKELYSRLCKITGKQPKSVETRIKIGEAAKKWKRSAEHILKLTEGRKKIRVITPSGEKHYLWKGDNVSYRALHHWVQRHKGKATKCSLCNKEGNRIHWANISHNYLRKLSDWMSLCAKCHRAYDLKY